MKLWRLKKPRKSKLTQKKIVVDAIANLSKLEQDFAEKEKVLITRAEKAEQDLETLRTGYENAMKILNRMITCFFGKFITIACFPL